MLMLIVDFDTMLIGAEGTKTPAGGRGWGDPAGASAEEAISTRGKRNAWSGNQQAVSRAFIYCNKIYLTKSVVNSGKFCFFDYRK